MTRLPEKINSSTLKRRLGNDESAAVVLFSGEWCPDCREFAPTWRRWIADKSFPHYVLEVPRGGSEWEEWQLDEIPTVGVYMRGREIARVHGVISLHDLDDLLERARRQTRS